MSIKRKLIAMIIGVEAVMIIAIIVFLFYISSDTVKVNRQLELAQRYLLEEDYEQAIAAYEIVIEIDPKNVDAYLGLAEAYAAADELGNAVRTLEKAAAQTDSEEILEMLQIHTAEIEQRQLAAQRAAEAAVEEETFEYVEVTEVFSEPETKEAIEVSLQEEEPDIYDDLIPFLVTFVFGYNYMSTGTEQDYDCRTASLSGLLEAMVREGSCYISDWYPYNTGEYQWTASDPLKRWDSYGSVSMQQIDWCLKNIFNCSDEDIVRMKSNLLLDNNDFLYLYDGYYYYYIGGIGSQMGGYIESVIKTGNQYNVIWVLTDADEIVDHYNAVVEVKIIDNKKYWSLYSNKLESVSQTENNPEQSKEKVYVEEYKNKLREIKKEENTADYIVSESHFALVYVDNDEIPELVVIESDEHGFGGELYTYYDNQVIYLGAYGSWGDFGYAPRTGFIYSGWVGEGFYVTTIHQLSNGKVADLCRLEVDESAYQMDETNRILYYVNDVEVTQQEYEEQDKELTTIYKIEDEEVMSYSDLPSITEENLSIYIQ